MNTEHNIKLTTADIMNFVTVINYLKNTLQKIDVSDDFAPDEETSVDAYELITDTVVFDELMNCINK